MLKKLVIATLFVALFAVGPSHLVQEARLIATSATGALGGIVNEVMPAKLLIDQVKDQSEKDSGKVIRAQVANQHQRQDLKQAENLSSVLSTRRDELKHEISFVSDLLRQPGEMLEPVPGARVARHDAEAQMAELHRQYKEVDAEIDSLTLRIKTGNANSAKASEEIAAARRKLIADNSWSRLAEGEEANHTIRRLTAGGRETSTIESLAAGDDPIDDKKRAVERKIGLVGDLETEEWSMWSGGHATKTEALLAESEKLLGVHGAESEIDVSTNNR